MSALRQMLFLVLLPLLALSLPGQSPAGRGAARHESWTLPLTFERNEGQLPKEIAFLGRTSQYAVAVDAKGLRFALPGSRASLPVVLSFLKSHAASPTGLAEASFRTNSYLGADPSEFRTGIHNYSRIGLSHIYPGVDAVFYATGEELEHDFYVAPGADPDSIAMRLSGGQRSLLNEQGEVLVPSERGTLRFKKPVAYQVDKIGKRAEVSVSFVLDESNPASQDLRFKLGPYDHGRTLVIDPVIVYATFAAGTAGSTANAIAVDPSNNVYIAGVTASTAFASTPTPAVDCGSAPCTGNVFLAQLASNSHGSALQWITYIGTQAVGSTTTVTSLVTNGTALSVAGSTNASSIASGATTAAVNPTGGYVGYISGLAASTGTLYTTGLLYLDAAPNNSSVQALALDAAGNLYASGALGTTLPGTPLLIQPTANAFAQNPGVTSYTATAQPQPGNAFVAEFPAAGPLADATTSVATPSFFTYVQQATQLNGIAVDSGGLVYVGGHTAGGFALAEGAGPATNTTAQNNAFELTFTPNTGTTAPTVNAFTWIDGAGSDTVAGIALAGSGTSYLFGNTTSTNLPSTSGLIQAAPADAIANGFVALAGASGTTGVAPTALTYLGGSGSTDTITGGAFANGAVYITGQTNAPPTTGGSAIAFAGVATTTASASAPFNTQSLAYGMDATSPSATRGYLASLSGALTSVNYVANIGGAGGSDTATSVALDSAQNAYVAGTIGLSSAPYTSVTAYQASSPSTSAPSAYVAQIAYAPSTAGLVLQPATTGSPSVNPVGYATASLYSSVIYTWVLTALTATNPTNLVVQVPAVPQLTYTGASLADATNPSAAAIPCTITTGGASCIVTTLPQTGGINDTLNLVVNAVVPASAATLTGTFQVTATVSGPASDYASSAQSNILAAPSILTITPATTFAPVTVFSTNNAATGPGTQATYAFTLANTGTTASPTANFALTLPNYLQIASVIANTTGGGVATTCDTVGATGCAAINLPAGASLLYTVTGTYLDAAVGSAGSSSAAPSFSATASGFLATTSATINPNTTVERGVHLKVAGALSAIPTGQTAFNLGDPLIFTITVTNSGPSSTSGTDPLTVTLPAGFVVTGGSGFSCPLPYTTCGVSVPVLAAGASTTFTAIGSFPDTATNASVLAAAQSKAFSASIPLPLVSSFESGGPATDYATTVVASVQRTAVLTVTASSLIAPGTVCAGGSGTCVYMTNAADAQDQVPYSVAIKNAGPNTAVNASITLTLPFAPANPAGTPHPLYSASMGTPTVATPAFGTALTCAPLVASTNQIVCSGGNLPVTATALAFSGNAKIDAATIPATVAYTTTAAAPGSIVVTEGANGAPPAVTLPVIEVDRAAHLVTAKLVVPTGTTPSSPINLDENNPSLAPGINDTLTITVRVGNTPLNAAPGVIVTDTLPAYFRVTVPPPASANCTVGGVAVTANYVTQATPVTMTCSIGAVTVGNAIPSAPGTPAVVGSIYQSFTYSGKFQDNGINADITGGLLTKVRQLSLNLPAAVATTAVAVDPVSPSDATSTSPSITIIRAAHLVLRKTRNASVATAPSSYVDTTDPNLDEKTTATPFGVNDEVEYGIAVGNAGVNTALGVQFTETLPPYFMLVRAYLVAGAPLIPDSGPNASPTSQLPASSLACYAGTAVGSTPIAFPYATSASPQPITCTYGTAASPLSLPAGPSHTGIPDNATSIEFVYQGKYQDNAPAADNILAGSSIAAIASNPGEAAAAVSLSVDNGSLTDSRSLALPAYAIQRAAHLAIVGTPQQLKPDETALTPGGVNGTSVIAQAEPSTTGGTPVYNCLRYKVLIQNSGPNIARQPRLTLAPPPGLILTESPNATTTAASIDAPLPNNCAYGVSIAPVVAGAVTVPTTQRPGNTLVIDVDAYFGLNTLTAGNSQTGFSLAYTGLSDVGTKESQKAVPFAPITGSNLTVVNTPAGANFAVVPFSTTGTRPARLSFGAVATPGITTEAIAATGPAVPTGPSPDPRDNRKTIPLYRTGTSPQFYSFGTTAIPAAGANPTGICLTSGGTSPSLADTFAKPERVLLWALAGLPSGTGLNPVPYVVAPYSGDITTGVTPANGVSYVEAGGPALPYLTAANFPAVQSQPAQVCGQINGFAPSAAPVTIAVLEPVNFAPLITANPQQPAQSPGKGVGEVSFLFPQTIHDYNDNDPCYVAPSTTGAASRGVCDDNLVLTTYIFGAENLVPSLGHVVGPLAPPASQAFLNASTAYEVQAGATLFLQSADQLAVLAYNAARNCDPGNAPGSYTPLANVPPCPLNTAALSGAPPQETIFGSADIALLIPSVNGGTSALVALPPAADATSVTTLVQTGYVMATSTITAGQTAGFQWSLIDVIPATGGTYTLTCFIVDNATQKVAAALPAGLSCQIPASIAYPASPTAANSPANPAIYIVTTGATIAESLHPGWKTFAGGIASALLLPLLLLRRSRVRWLAVLLILFGGAVGLSGCGTGFNAVSVTTATAPGTYTFRATATPVKGGVSLTTAPFQVKVVAGN